MDTVPPGPTGYAANGKILTHTDSVMGTWSFTYDAVDRLVSATPGGSNPTEYQGKYGCWSYDSFGNRTLEAFSTVTCTGSNPTPQAKAVYNQANNRIQSISGTTSATFIYDASGNTLYDGNNYYWYDAEGQLCAVQKAIGGTITQYVYDAEGARIAKGTLASAPSLGATCPSPLGSGFAHTARWLVDQGGDQVTEFDNGNWAHSNIWAGGKLTATYDTKGIHYELADPLGTKRVQANAAGQVDETCTSLPFGNDVGNPIGANCATVANSLGTQDDATEHHFTQKERDTESGNDYFFARYYSSALGRFTTPDWSAKTDPVPYALFGDPQSLNLYAYVRNNPITAVDLDGHEQPCGFWCNISGQYDKLAASFYQSSQESTQKAAQQQQAQPQSGSSTATSLASNVGGGGPLELLGKIMGLFGHAKAAKEAWDDGSELAGWIKVKRHADAALKRDSSNSRHADPRRIQVDSARGNLAYQHIAYLMTSEGITAIGETPNPLAAFSARLNSGFMSTLKQNIDQAQQQYNRAWSSYVADLNSSNPQ